MNHLLQHWKLTDQLVNYDSSNIERQNNIYQFDEENSKKMGTAFVESGSAIGNNFEQIRIDKKKVNAPPEFNLATLHFDIPLIDPVINYMLLCRH